MNATVAWPSIWLITFGEPHVRGALPAAHQHVRERRLSARSLGRGTAHAAQDDREATLGPGDFALFDSSRPYSIAFPGSGAFEHVIYQVPRASLDARRQIREATARRVPAATAAGQLAFPYLTTLARHAESQDGQVPARAFIDAGLDLAVSALRATAGYLDQAGPGHRLLASELTSYALARLGDPGLSPQAVARASYISARQLHRLFARDGLTFGGCIREERLRRCHADLASQQLAHLPIAQIAARWGFRSPRRPATRLSLPFT